MRRGRYETTARSQVGQKEHGRVLVVKPLNFLAMVDTCIGKEEIILKVEGIESRAWVEERHKYGNSLQLFLPGESHRQRSLADCNESDRTEHTHTHKRLQIETAMQELLSACLIVKQLVVKRDPCQERMKSVAWDWELLGRLWDWSCIVKFCAKGRR